MVTKTRYKKEKGKKKESHWMKVRKLKKIVNNRKKDKMKKKERKN